ncbi:signal peptidase I [Limibacillus sp. MBR-115]|jgi:signal peptidase I
MTESQDKTMSREKTGGWGETFRTVIYAVLIAVVVRTFAYEPFSIPSGSMLPTLLVGDYLFVSKMSYGYSRHSMPFSPNFFDGRILADEPERGDVAVFKLPSDGETDYIKRLVGMPGDRIQVKAGILYINDEPVKREKVRDVIIQHSGGYSSKVTQYVETLPGGRQHLIWERSDNEFLDNTPLYVVPAGHYFAMGDNRDSSQDSRVMSVVGFVPFENLVGRADVLFFSLEEGASILAFWNWPTSVRWGRIFDGIE